MSYGYHEEFKKELTPGVGLTGFWQMDLRQVEFYEEKMERIHMKRWQPMAAFRAGKNPPDFPTGECNNQQKGWKEGLVCGLNGLDFILGSVTTTEVFL